MRKFALSASCSFNVLQDAQGTTFPPMGVVGVPIRMNFGQLMRPFLSQTSG